MITFLSTRTAPYSWGRFTHAVATLLAVAMTVMASAPASAQLTGRQSEGSLSPIPIAIPEFVGDNPKLAVEISNVVANDLESSGLFKPLDRASFLEAVRDINAPPRMVDWRSI